MGDGLRQELIAAEDLRTEFHTFEGVVKALNQVSVTVENGETYGLVGESGCGKSVTVRSMMRIVQEPGRIVDGKIVIFFDEKDRQRGVDLLLQSDAYVEQIRGNDISMIFQEASTALNPVLSIGYQVGESFEFHRLSEMLAGAIEDIEKDLESGSLRLFGFRRLAIALLRRERKSHLQFEEAVEKLDRQIISLENANVSGNADRIKSLNRRRERMRPHDWLTTIARRVPLLRRYRRYLSRTIRRFSIELLTSLGVPNPANVYERYPHELSGGMQQRIVIAIALACDPKLLIADEPTSNLDVTIQAQIVDLIKRLKETKISSVVFITHDLGLVAEVCDRVSVMYAGDVVETASVRELFNTQHHPYTKGLLASVPKRDQEGALHPIPGTVPNLIHPPSGCRFHPRCPVAKEICARVKPRTTEMSEGHSAACHLLYEHQEIEEEHTA